ncbi:unnamed protein product [Linum tenue]|uniref:Uncharacterized protein n=1 Tax=Linum tenue TaxID=586396 RepID=A0AAV0NID6_9ROSI|nr:unnamed protein product [Linum tenue]
MCYGRQSSLSSRDITNRSRNNRSSGNDNELVIEDLLGRLAETEVGSNALGLGKLSSADGWRRDEAVCVGNEMNDSSLISATVP